MADEENINADGDAAIDETVPEMWKLAKPPAPTGDDEAAKTQAASAAQIGKLVKYLNDIEDQEEFETKVAERDPATGQSLLLWATLNNKFVLVEWLVKKAKRAAFAFSNAKKEITVADKWTEVRKELEDKEREKLLNPPEETPADDGEEEEKPPEPTADQLVQDALGDLQEELGNRFQCVIKSVGELGVYQGARDEAGTKTGLGQTLFPNGDMYCGQYRDNQREGVGTYYFAHEGMIYTGQWHANLRHGVGRCVTADGSRYFGQWYRDQRHGEGRYTYPDGSSYAGEWDQGVKQGKGTYQFTDGSKHVGSFVDGDFVSGEWILSGGVRYVGKFKNGAPYGKGVFVFKSTRDTASSYQTVGEYRDGAWNPGKTSTANDVPSVDITVQNKILTVTTTNEVGTLPTEELVRIVNFGAFQSWVAKLESGNSQHYVEGIQIAGVRYSAANDIDEVTLKLSVIDKSGKRVKDADRVVLRTPTTRLVVLLKGGDKTVALLAQAPNASLLTTEQLAFPTVTATASGSVRGEAVELANRALRLNIGHGAVMALPLPTLTSDAGISDHAQQCVAYIQSVHADTLATAQAKLDAAQSAAGFSKLRVVRLEDVGKMSTDAATIVAASFLLRNARSLPAQTVDPQRPPTPIPPPALPRPDIEPLLAAERAKNAKKTDEE